MSIATNLAQIRQQIDDACRQAGRAPESVRLVAVSKVKPAEAIGEALATGQTLFGESYVQEFTTKEAEVTGPVEWHFIGHLQTNKVKYLRGKVALIHSVDRLALAEEINRQWGKIQQPASILLQVNIGGEQTKSGTDEAGLMALAEACSALPWLRVTGLMTLPPYALDAEDTRPYFRRLRALRDRLAARQLPRVAPVELSMGMSHDFAVAIAEGATLVRVGTAIFGQR